MMMRMRNKKFAARLTACVLTACMAAVTLAGCTRELTEEQSEALIALQNSVTYYENAKELTHWEDLVALAAANRADGIGINWNALSLPDTPEAPILVSPQTTDGDAAGNINGEGNADDAAKPPTVDSQTPGTGDVGSEGIPDAAVAWTFPDVSSYPGAIITSILKGEDYNALAASLASAQNPADGAFSDAYVNQHIWSMITLTAAVGRDGYDYDKAAAYLLTFQREDGGFGYSVDAAESDVNLTGIASVALAPYYEKHKKSAEMKSLVAFYKEKQTADGGYEGFGGENAATIASAIWGLSALNQNLPTTEDGLSPVDALLSYQNEDGSFRALKEDDPKADALSTRQATIALCDVVNDVNTYVLLAEDAESYRIENISGPAITLNIDYPNGSDIPDVSTPFTIEEGASAFDALALYGKIKEIPIVFTGKDASIYVKSINGLSEKEYGDASGWVFKVNDAAPLQGPGAILLHEGDVLTWVFVKDAAAVSGAAIGAGDGEAAPQ